MEQLGKRKRLSGPYVLQSIQHQELDASERVWVEVSTSGSKKKALNVKSILIKTMPFRAYRVIDSEGHTVEKKKKKSNDLPAQRSGALQPAAGASLCGAFQPASGDSLCGAFQPAAGAPRSDSRFLSIGLEIN